METRQLIEGATQHIPLIKMLNGKWTSTDKDKADTFPNNFQKTFLHYTLLKSKQFSLSFITIMTYPV